MARPKPRVSDMIFRGLVNPLETDPSYAVGMSQRIDLLARHHLRLLEIIATARPMLTALSHEADLGGLRHLRREMVEALVAYQRFVHEEVFEPTMQNGSPEARRDALELKLDCIRLQQDYDAFGLRWAQRNALSSWSEYRLSAVRMMKQFRDHVLAVNDLRKGWSVQIGSTPAASQSYRQIAR